MVGTIQCDNPDVLKKLLLGKQELPYKKHLKKAASATAGSQVDLPRVEQELGTGTTSKNDNMKIAVVRKAQMCVILLHYPTYQ